MSENEHKTACGWEVPFTRKAEAERVNIYGESKILDKVNRFSGPRPSSLYPHSPLVTIKC